MFADLFKHLKPRLCKFISWLLIIFIVTQMITAHAKYEFLKPESTREVAFINAFAEDDKDIYELAGVPTEVYDKNIQDSSNEDLACDGIIVSYKRGYEETSDTIMLQGYMLNQNAYEEDNIVLLEVSSDEDVSTILQELRNNPDVDYAEPNYRFYTTQFPDDTRFEEQWAFNALRVEQAWREADNILKIEERVAEQTVVAVLDTGVDSTHEDLFGRILTGYNVINPMQQGAMDDSLSSHGTFVAGIITATTNNGKGIAGIAGEFPISILPVKVLNQHGVGTMLNISQGIRWAADNGAHIINLSLGARLPDYPRTLADAIQYAQDKGIIVVASAGNEGKSVEGFYPACLSSVISVGSCDKPNERSVFSNYNSSVIAPGSQIITTARDNKYELFTGTSAAAPFTAGTAALLRSIYPSKSAHQIRSAVLEGHWFYGGDRYLDTEKALIKLKDLNGSSYYNQARLLIDHTGQHFAGKIELTAQVTNADDVSAVMFYYIEQDKYNDPEREKHFKLIKSIQNDGNKQSGLYTVEWDTTLVDDGAYYIITNVYDMHGNNENNWSWSGNKIIISNETKSGMALHILKPDGTAAAGAKVTVWNIMGGDGSKVYVPLNNSAYKTDMNGKLIIPGSIATDGNDYLVTVRGSDPEFIYFRSLRTPVDIVIDSRGTEKVTISGKDINGNPLSLANIFIDYPQMSRDKFKDGISSDMNEFEMIPAGKLNPDGVTEVYLDKGHYNFRLLDVKKHYYLNVWDIEVAQGGGNTIKLHPSPSDVAVLKLLQGENDDADFFDVVFKSQYEEYNLGFGVVSANDDIYVSSGSYDVQVSAYYADSITQGEYWRWKLDIPEFEVLGGNEHSIGLGGRHGGMKGTIEPYAQMNPPQGFVVGNSAWFKSDFTDLEGNRTAGISKINHAGVLPLGQSLIIKQIEPINGIQLGQNASAGGERYNETYYFNTYNSDFKMMKETYVLPKLKVSNPQGSHTYLYGRSMSYISLINSWVSYWDVPSGQMPQDYKAWVEFDAGSFGAHESNKMSFTAQIVEPLPPVQPDVVVRLLDRKGNSTDGRIVLLKKTEGNYIVQSPNEWRSGYSSTYDGKCSFSGLDEGQTYGIAVYMDSSIDDVQQVDYEKVFLYKTFVKGKEPLELYLDASSFNLKKVNLKARDHNNESFQNSQDVYKKDVDYYIYARDEDGVPLGMYLETLYSWGDTTDLSVWVPCIMDNRQTDYTFRAAVVSQWPNDIPLYLMNKTLSIPVEGPDNGLDIVLGADELGEVKITIQQQSQDEVSRYLISKVVLYSEGIGYSPVFQLLKSEYGSEESNIMELYVTEGNYEADILMGRIHYSGDWGYWLRKSIDVKSGETLECEISDKFKAGIELDFDQYNPGDQVCSKHFIEDPFGARIIALKAGGELGTVQPNSLKVEKEDEAKAQYYYEIAPFLVIQGTDGNEIYRHKYAPSVNERFGDWHRTYNESISIPIMMPMNKDDTTYLNGTYNIPQNARAGYYKALLEFGNGPDGIIRSEEVSFTVGGAATVSLNTITSPTNAASIDITGRTLPGAMVEVNYTHLKIGTVTAGIITAEQDGWFTLEGIELHYEGQYTFTAVASLNDISGTQSSPVSLVVDRTPSNPPVNLQGTSPASSHIQLSWGAPEGEAISYYEIKRDQVVIASNVTGGAILNYMDSELEKNKEYTYEVFAIDKAGNKSQPATVTVRTAIGEDKEPPTTPVNLFAVVDKHRIRLTWEPATDNVGVSGYKIYRFRIVNNEASELVLEKSEDVGLQMTWTDENPDPGTIYVYAVTAYDQAGNESLKEGEGAATFKIEASSLLISSFTWQGTRSKYNLLVPRTELKFVLVADRERHGSVDIEYTSWSNLSSPIKASIPLVEDKDAIGLGTGIYKGKYDLPDGASEIISLTGILGDGKGYSIISPARGVPAGLSGMLTVVVDGAEHEILNDAQLILWSPSKNSGTKVDIKGPGTYIMDELNPSEDYNLRITSKNNRLLGHKDNICIASGYNTEITVNPALPATLDVTIKDKNGIPIPSARVLISRENGNALVNGISSYNGMVMGQRRSDLSAFLLSSELAGTKIVISVSLADCPREFKEMYMEPVPMEVVLEDGHNSIDIIVLQRPRTSIQGVVKFNGEFPVKNTKITVYQTLGNSQISKFAETDDNGYFSINLITGNAKLVVSHWKHGYVEVDLESLIEGEAREIDINFPVNKVISLAVYTQRIGDTAKRMDMDWRVGVHLHITGYNLGQPGKTKNHYINMGNEYGAILVPNPEPGDVIRIKADGKEAGMGTDTIELILDENCYARGEINLVEKGIISSIVQDTHGNSRSSEKRYMQVFRHEGENMRYVNTFNSESSQLNSRNLDEGTYTIVYHWKPIPSSARIDNKMLSPARNYNDMVYYLGQNCVIKGDIEVREGKENNLGIIILPYPEDTTTGYFRGKDGNDFTASRYETGPGSIITLRAGYKFEGANNAPKDLKLCLGIPQNARLVENSISIRTVKGKVTPEASIRPGSIEVNFKDSAVDGIEGSVVYQVRMGEHPDWPVAGAYSWAEFNINGRVVREDIGSVEISVPYVTLTAPSDAEKREIPLSGRAPAGSLVRIYDGYYFLAEVVTAANGLWQATVMLPDRGNRAYHFLRAQVDTLVTETDEEPPVWPESSILRVSDIQRESVYLSWPAAADNVGVKEYIVTATCASGEISLTRATGNTEMKITGLKPGTQYIFSVYAEDLAYNVSVKGPSAEAKTTPPDTTSPVWQSSLFEATEVKFYTAKLTWPLATDNEMKEYHLTAHAEGKPEIGPIILKPDVNSSTISGLEKGITYTFTIEAIDQSGNKSSLQTTATTPITDTTPPVWPQGASISIDRLLHNQVVLSWPRASDNIDVFRYFIYQQQSDGSFIQVGTQYGNSDIRTGLIPERTYTFKIEACDRDDNRTNDGPIITFTTPVRDVTPPVWPEGASINVTNRTHYGMTFSWTQAVDEQSGIGDYRVIFYDEHDKRWLYYSGSQPSVNIQGFKRGDIVRWEIWASDPFGNQTVEPLSITYEVQPEDQTPPSWPLQKSVEILERGYKGVLVRWSPTNDESCTKYLLQVFNESNQMVVETSVGSIINEWWIGSLADMIPGNTYKIKVQAVDRYENVSTDGPEATFTTITKDDSPPQWRQGSNLTVSQYYSNNSAISLQWPQAIDFQLHYYEVTGTDSSGKRVDATPIQTQQTGCFIWGLTPGQTYTFQVNAVDREGNKSIDGPVCTVTMSNVNGGSGSAESMSAQSSSVNYRTVYSAPVTVMYDPDQPRVTSVFMRQSDGRKVNFEPVAKFPYVLVPGNSFDFDVKFSDATRVEDMRIHADNGAIVGGRTSQGANTSAPVSVSGQLKGATTVPGRIYVSYKTLPQPWAGTSKMPINEEVVRSGMPRLWRDAVVNKLDYDDGNPNTRESRAEILVGGNPNMKLETTMIISEVTDFTPTQQDISKIAKGGPPIYNISMAFNESEKGFQYEFSAIIPWEEISIVDGMSAQSIRGKAGALVKFVIKNADDLVDDGLNVQSLYDTLKGGWDYHNDKQFDELEAFVKNSCRDAYFINSYLDEIEYERKKNTEETILKLGISLGFTVVGAFAGFGIGGAIGWTAANVIIDSAIDSMAESRMDFLKSRIYDNPMCKPEEEFEEYKKRLLADITWILDPSGYVYEAVPENRIEGVTATALEKVGGQWVIWDSEWFEQQNPLTTDGEGRYAWDVPEGMWKVLFEKEGYMMAESEELPVPPPQLEVNIGIVSLEAPKVKGIKAAKRSNSIDFSFDRYMIVDTINESTIFVAAHDQYNEQGEVEYLRGKITSINPQKDPNNSDIFLAREFRFIPDVILNVGEKYDVLISQMIKNYAGKHMDADFTETLEIEDYKVNDVSDIRVTSGNNSLKIDWIEPTNINIDKIQISLRNIGGQSYQNIADIRAGLNTYVIDGLQNGISYEIRITVIDMWGDSSDGGVISGTPRDTVRPDKVYNVRVNAGDRLLKLDWTEPENAEKIRICWKTAGAPSYQITEFISRGLNTYVITNLHNGVTYDVKITVFDKEGNRSEGVVVSGTPQAPVNGGETPGNGYVPEPPKKDNVIVEPSEKDIVESVLPSMNEQKFEAGVGQKTVKAFDGEVVIKIPKGAFKEDIILTVRKVSESSKAKGLMLTFGKTVYEIDAGGVQPEKPLILSISIDREALGLFDLQKAGIYHLEDKDTTKWGYMGGLLNEEDNLVTTTLKSFGVYALAVYDKSFDDIVSHWSRKTIEVLVSRQVIKGVNDKEFQPERYITRAEMAALIVRTMILDTTKGVYMKSPEVPTFLDVEKDKWYYEVVETAAYYGIVKGNNGSFRPNDFVTRQEMAAMITCMLKWSGAVALGNTTDMNFVDKNDISDWAKDAVLFAWERKIIIGNEIGEFKPKDNATRAHAATMIYRALENMGLLYELKETLGD